MSGFVLSLQSAMQCEQLEHVVSFVGEDASGSFGIQPGHSRFATALTFGLARVRYDDGRWEYLALPGAVAYFDQNYLDVSCRRYLRSDDYAKISQLLREELVAEESSFKEFRQSLEEMEQAMLRRLWRLRRGEELPL